MLMSEPNYDARLEPKYRRRTPDEIEAIVTEDYGNFLRDEIKAGRVKSVFDRLAGEHKQEAVDAIVQAILDQNGAGLRDKEFARTIDWDELESEIS
jgi:hypothetical protein